MVNRGTGAFCVAETGPLARRVKLPSADQSDSVQLGSGVGVSARVRASESVLSPSDPVRWVARRFRASQTLRVALRVDSVSVSIVSSFFFNGPFSLENSLCVSFERDEWLMNAPFRNFTFYGNCAKK